MLNNKIMNSLGTAIGSAGAALCLVSGGVRVVGIYDVAGYELRTLFLVGTGLMVMACLAKLHVLVDLQSRKT
jgi:hypothetical protein